MSSIKTEALTAHFYEWEKRGRGWYVFDKTIELEPEFIPFFPYVAPITKVVDESLRPTLFQKAASFIKDSLGDKGKQDHEETPYDYTNVDAFEYVSQEDLRGFSLSFSNEEKPLKSIDIERFLTMLSYSNSHICFEIFATSSTIRIQFVCRESDATHVESQIRAYFPSCHIQENTNTLDNIIDREKYYAIAELGLGEEFMRPILMADKFESDPLTGVYGILDNIGAGEQITLQFLFKGTMNPWAQSMYRSVTDSRGDSFFMNAPEMPKLTQEKISTPLFSVCIRVFGQGQTVDRAVSITQSVSNALIQNSKSGFNSLIPLSNEAYNETEHLYDIVLRQSHRIGMLLNAKELGTFVHYPVSVHSKKLKVDTHKTKVAPTIAWGHDFMLGKNTHGDFEGIVTLETMHRLKHMHVIGATGTGKSTLLQSCIVQDIHLGNGIAVLDPHGDLVESILAFIPENRYKDVVLIDPSDGEFPVGFNILNAHSDAEKEILASDLVAVFKRLSTSFGDQMYSVLANAILAFLESTEGGTLIDLRRFLIEKSFRDTFLKTVSDPSIVYYWQKEYPLLKSSSIGPILTRLDSFLRPKLIRNMVAQKKSLDFEQFMDTKKIVLIKLSQGLIGNENSYLLGTFFVSKIYQAAMARQAKSKDSRTNFFMYIDEFQNFITPSMSSILSGTRKYGLGCILAHQDMSQLQKYDTELANSVISNAGTRICFRVGDIDAKRFADGFQTFEAQDIQNLGLGEAICRIERPEYDFTMSTLQLKPIEDTKVHEIRNTVVAMSRNTYGTEKEVVEKSLEYLRDPIHETPPPKQKEKAPDITPEKENKDEIRETKIKQKTEVVEITDGKTKELLTKQKELSEHRYIQTYIKKMAEARGYKAEIEKPTANGGRVDVSLERNGKRIACEIGMTTTSQWELHNIQKCIASGYDLVVAIVKDMKTASQMLTEVSKLETSLQSKVKVLETESFIAYLDTEISKDMTTETRVKGYRVKVEYDTTETNHATKKDAITKIILSDKNREM